MKNKNVRAKISPEFAIRLGTLKKDQKIRAIVLLNSDKDEDINSNIVRKRGSNRVISNKFNKKSLEGIEIILEKSGGSKLSDRPNILGSILVETTAKGVSDLASLKEVKAIFEDQKIFQIK